MARGLVKEYSSDRGYGVIVDVQTGWQLMVYSDHLRLIKEGILRVGQFVEFDYEKNSERDSATNVRII